MLLGTCVIDVLLVCVDLQIDQMQYCVVKDRESAQLYHGDDT
jgi:hypothetical protein